MRLVLSTAVPLVAVSMALRRPSSARVGISYLMRVVFSEPGAWGGGGEEGGIKWRAGGGRGGMGGFET